MQTVLNRPQEPKKRSPNTSNISDDKDTAEGRLKTAVDPTAGEMNADVLYGNYENQQAAARRQLCGPSQLQLKEFDINMRKHRIVAGVFYVQHFETPQQDVKIHAKKYLRNSK